jgi:hypothetical protein
MLIMYSIHKTAGLLVAALLLGLGGCQMEQRRPGPEPLDNAPITVDPAMQQRDWPMTEALYVNDTVMAYPDLKPLQPTRTPTYETVVTEPALFLADTVYIPFGVFIEPQWKMVAYKSMSTPPTYTAMPPQLPSSENTIVRGNYW